MGGPLHSSSIERPWKALEAVSLQAPGTASTTIRMSINRGVNAHGTLHSPTLKSVFEAFALQATPKKFVPPIEKVQRTHIGHQPHTSLPPHPTTTI